ncbi:MAG TPA: family 16 glycoside hydrolase, partial [Chitinophagaceae bacterium]
MKKFLLAILLPLTLHCAGQKSRSGKAATSEIQIPMQASAWIYDTASIEFATIDGRAAARPKKDHNLQMLLKDQVFSNGTIEFDIKLDRMGFNGINFRQSDDGKTADNFYVRYFGPSVPERKTTLQYAAIVDEMSIWDLTDEYQAPGQLNEGEWNHVKLVVSGKQMKAFVNDMTTAALWVPELEGGLDQGAISLAGGTAYSNVVLRPGVVEGLDPQAGYISAYNDPHYIRHWQLSPQKDFPFGTDVRFPVPTANGSRMASDIPDSNIAWKPIDAEKRGIVNVSRVYGHRPNDARRIAWLKTTIASDRDQEKVLKLGFSDEVWI